MTESDLTVSILRDIRDSIRTLDSNLSSRIDATNERLDSTNERLETVDVRLSGVDVAVRDGNARLALVESALRDGAAQTLLLTRYLKNKTEVEVAELRERIAKLEAKVG